MLPITEHSFTLLAAKRLFLARTNDCEMFLCQEDNKKFVNYDKDVENDAIKQEL